MDKLEINQCIKIFAARFKIIEIKEDKLYTYYVINTFDSKIHERTIFTHKMMEKFYNDGNLEFISSEEYIKENAKTLLVSNKEGI